MKKMLKNYQQQVESFLETCLQNEHIPEELQQAMHYSLMAGGKRIRPVLCLAWAEYYGLQASRILRFASALELIHTYSLVHDDLPAIDNDHLRRGQPSSHVQFGEAMAILTGDALLTQAFAFMLQTDLKADLVLQAASQVAQASGPSGMVGGQVLDMQLTGQDQAELQELQTMHSLKTGAIIRCSCLCGTLLAGADQAELQKADTYGRAIGLAFQVADDILDIVGDSQAMGKPSGSDQQQGKLTYPGLLGLEESKALGWDLVRRARATIADEQNPQALFLQDLAEYIMYRTK